MSSLNISKSVATANQDHVDSIENGKSAEPLKEPPYFRWKGMFDRILALLLLIPGIPMIAFLVLLVRLTSHGAGVFRQVRSGKNGQDFVMYKIRTMTINAESLSGAVWTQTDDLRVTRLGYYLRKFHLDELPQLFNVVKGEMSLIGPRPERPEFVDILAEKIPGYLNRLTVSPGITGLAQIYLSPDTNIESVRRKLEHDIEYIESAGVFLDCSLFLCTFLRLLGFRGDLAKWMISRLANISELDQGNNQTIAPLDVLLTPEQLVNQKESIKRCDSSDGQQKSEFSLSNLSDEPSASHHRRTPK